jgi:hypothetical protein
MAHAHIFTIRLEKVEDSRAQKNPAGKARKSTIEKFLSRLHKAIAKGQVRALPSAKQEARKHFDLTEAGILQVLDALRYRHFDRRELSHHVEHEGVVVWHFEHDFNIAYQVPHMSRRLYLVRITVVEDPGWYVIKFHRSIEDEGYVVDKDER